MMLLEGLQKPWPWYVSGPLIGLIVPTLLVLGNKSFGMSSSLRHICAACFPAKIPFFNYEWKKEAWNLFFALGVIAAGVFAIYFELPTDHIDPEIVANLPTYNLATSSTFPFTIAQHLPLLIVGGFLLGFGSRYAGGCTSGHAIMGIATLQWPSLVATLFFMFGGFVMVNYILPFLLTL